MEIKGINVLKNITLYRGKRPSNLSSYIETNRNSSNLPYPIQSDISNGLLNTSKRFFKQDMGFKFNISKKGDLFISASCDIGNVVILDEDEAFIDDKFIKFSPNENIKINYLKYWLVKNKKEIMKLGYGTTFQMLYLQQLNNFLKDQYLPSLLTQQSIIDIIEPFENSIKKINEKKERIIQIIQELYLLNSEKTKIPLNQYIEILNNPFENQKKYIDTSMVGNLSIENGEKILKKKSRANLSVEMDSIIISKMDGENKVYPIYDKKLLENIYSTGFFNITSSNNIHLIGFLLTNSFITQKSNSSVGTLMSGMNKGSFNSIYINEYKEKTIDLDFILNYINIIDEILKKFNQIINNLIELYIK